MVLISNLLERPGCSSVWLRLRELLIRVLISYRAYYFKVLVVITNHLSSTMTLGISTIFCPRPLSMTSGLILKMEIMVMRLRKLLCLMIFCLTVFSSVSWVRP